MNWKKRLTNYNFWISIVSAVLLIFQAFNIKFDIVYVNEIATAVLGLLVVIGIISDPTKVAVKEVKKPEETKKEDNQEKVEEEKPKESEVIEEMPAEIKNENDANFIKDDFKILIEKISTDLHNLATKQVENAEIKKVEQEIPAQEEPVVEVQTFNIVN